MALSNMARRIASRRHSLWQLSTQKISVSDGSPSIYSSVSADTKGELVSEFWNRTMSTYSTANKLISKPASILPRFQHLFSTGPTLPPIIIEDEDLIDEEDIFEADTIEEPILERTKLLVLGGNGFVGSAVCKEALDRGLIVASLNRSGPPGVSEPWVKEVDWLRGDILNTASWRHHLRDASAVVSCVGAFGSNDFMRKVNGEANAGAAAAAAEEGVKRFVYISAHDVGLPSFVLRGYYEGKKQAEDAVREHFPYGGVILRPGMIHGSRRVGNMNLPLNYIGGPLELLLKNAKWASQLPIVGPALVPPVKVTTVARAAVRGAIDNAIPPTALSVWDILRFGEQ